MRRCLLLLPVIVSSCAVEEISSGNGPPTVSDSESQEPFDSAPSAAAIQELIRRTRYSFLQHEGVLYGGDATAGLRVDRDGIEVRGYLWPDGAIADVTTDYQAGVVETAPLRLHTQRIGSDATLLWSADESGSPELQRTGLAHFVRGDCIEVIRPKEGGFEQSWRFDEAPAIRGNLIIEVAVTGQSYESTTATGLHFRDPATGLGFAYGHATWIDSTGARTTVEAAIDDGIIRLEVSAATLQASTFPAVLDPIVGGEMAYDTPITGPASDHQSTPRIASSGDGGTEYLVVWGDQRRGPLSFFSSEVFGARVSPFGSVWDTYGFIIPQTTGGAQHSPDVVWVDNGIHQYWMVPFVAIDSGISTVFYKAVYLDGTIFMPDLAVSSSVDPNVNAHAPRIAFNPFSGGTTSKAAIVWERSGTAEGVAVATIPMGGPAEDPGGPTAFAILTPPPNDPAKPTAFHVDIASSGTSTGFFATWSDLTPTRNISGRSVGGGIPIPAAPILTITSASGTQQNPTITYGDGKYVVIWEDWRTANANIWGQRVNSAGTGLIGTNFTVSNAIADQLTPDIEVGGAAANQFLATWSDSRAGNRDIYGTRMTSNGLSITINDGTSTGILISGAGSTQSEPAIAYDKSGLSGAYFVVWQDGRPPNSQGDDVYGARVLSSTGVVQDPSGLLIASSVNQQSNPAIAACNGRYLTVWLDSRNHFSSLDLYGAITDTSGTVLVKGIQLSSGSPNRPDVACNGTDFYVVWEDNSKIYGARVQGSTGTVLDPGGVQISGGVGGAGSPAVAYSAATSTYLVAWSGFAPIFSTDIWGRRVNAVTGQLIAPEFDITGDAPANENSVAVSADSNYGGAVNRFLVAWTDDRNISGNANRDIYARFVDVNQSLGTTIQLTTSISEQTMPEIATRPATPTIDRYHYVVYRDASVPGLGSQIVTASGSLGSSLSFSGGSTTLPHTLVRRDNELMLLIRTFDGNPYGPVVNGEDVDVSPLSVVGGTFTIFGDPDIDAGPGVAACASTTNCTVAYRRWEGSLESSRLYHKVLTY